MKRRLSCAFVLLVVFATPAFSYQTFMKIGNVKGTANESQHKDWIVVSSFSVGVTHGGGGATSSVTVRVPDFPSLAQLASAVGTGQRFQTVLVDVATQRYTLQDVVISSYAAPTHSGAAGSGEAVLVLNYLHSSIEYTPKPNTTAPGMSVIPATNVPAAITSPNAPVIINDVAGGQVLGLRFSGEHDGVLKIHESAGGFFQQAAASKASSNLTVKKQYFTITLTNCTITSYSLNRDGTSTAGIHFSQYQGPAGGF